MDEFSENEYGEENSHQMEEDMSKPTFPSPSPGKNVSSSVQEFLKQSSEIQEEIRKLSELCQQISPKKDSFIEEAPRSKEEYEQNSIIWEQLNNLLTTHGFNPIAVYRDEYDQDNPDINSLSDTLVEVITEYSNLSRNFEEMKTSYTGLEEEFKEIQTSLEKSKKLESQYKDLDKINRQLQEKLNKCKLELKGKDEALAKVTTGKAKPIGDRAVNIFKAFMEQEYNPMRDNDAKVMAIIQNYEEQKQKLIGEIANYKKELESINNSFKKQKERSIEDAEYEQKRRARTNLSESNDPESNDKIRILMNAVKQLSLKSYQDIPNALNKIQQVMLTLPGIDKFVKQICEEIMLSPSSRLDEVLETLREIKRRLQVLEKFRQSVFENLASTNENEVNEKIRGLSYFCKLFEVKPKDDIINSIESIFFFVHEIKMFLAVIVI